MIFANTCVHILFVLLIFRDRRLVYSKEIDVGQYRWMDCFMGEGSSYL